MCTDAVAFFLEHTSGFLCVALDEQRAADLELDLMVSANDPASTAWSASATAR